MLSTMKSERFAFNKSSNFIYHDQNLEWNDFVVNCDVVEIRSIDMVINVGIHTQN